MIVIGDVLDGELVQPFRAAPTNAEMVIGDEQMAARDVMLGLAVSLAAGEMHVVIATPIAATGRGQDHAAARR